MTLMMGFPGMIRELNGQTKVFDQTITWTHPPYEYGGYGFYWWHRTDGYSIINYGDMPSDNWASPNNYYNGEFTMSVEVISQPTTDPFWIQFGIWGDKYKGTLHTETMAARQWVNGGAGSSGSYSLGSPSTWWNKQPSDPLDFNHANDFYRIGVVLWNTSPLCVPMGTEWNPDGCPEYGARFFPMTIRIRVYASSGTYVPPVTPPSYTIDYPNERTGTVVSTQDQYSYSSSFSPVYDGNGQFLSLSPGTNVYFRKKSDYSKTQTLTVPGRPGTPSFGIDYPNERTSTTVSSEYRYSSNSDMSASSTGDGSYVSLTPGSNRYFRKSATGSAFASSIQTLTVPGRPGAPSFGIDYPNERTSTTVSSDYRYSSNSDMSSSSTGDGSYVSVTPGSNRYFRKLGTASEFASSVQELIVPSRPASPAFGIDFINGRTTTIIDSSHEYGLLSDMSDAVSGTGDYLAISPEVVYHIRKKATSSAFRSGIQSLVAPARPSAPSFQIDYLKEEISVPVETGYLYANNPDMSSAIQGSGNLVQVTPGVNIYFQGLASTSEFASEVQTLVSPPRPEAPTVGIDYVNESTDKSISPELQYSGSSGFEIAENGTGLSLNVVPGEDLFFRQDATVSSFSSEVFQLVVPERPVVSSAISGSTSLYPFIIDFTFFQKVASQDITNISVVNAELKYLNIKSSGTTESIFEGLVYATANDVISILLPTNSIQEGNFTSNTFEVTFTGQLPGVGIESTRLSTFYVYPNPGSGVFHLKIDDFNTQANYRVELCSITGKVVQMETFSGTEDMRLDLSGLPDGIYLLRLSDNEVINGVVKLIIK